MRKDFIEVIKKLVSNIYVVLAVLVLTATVALVSDYLSYMRSQKSLDLTEFNQTLHKKQTIAMDLLTKMMQETGGNLEKLQSNSFYIKQSKENGIECRVYRKNNLIYWTDNEINVDSLSEIPDKSEFYYCAANYHTVGSKISSGDYHYIALIKVKTFYYPHEMKVDKFCDGFNLPNHVRFVGTDNLDAIVVNGNNGAELFRLQNVTISVPDQLCKQICFFSWIIFGIFLYLLLRVIFLRYNDGKLSKLYFAGIIGCILLFVLFCGSIRQPAYIFGGSLFDDSSGTPLGVVLLYTIIIILYYSLVIKRLLPSELLFSGDKWHFLIAYLGHVLIITLGVVVYAMARVFIYSRSNVDLAVPYVQDISKETCLALFVFVVWIILYANIVAHLMNLTQRRLPIKSVVLIRVINFSIFFFIVFLIDDDSVKYTFPWMIAMLLLKDIFFFYDIQSRNIFIGLIAFLILNFAVALLIKLSSARNEFKISNLASRIESNALMNYDSTLEQLMDNVESKFRQDVILKAYLVDTVNRQLEIETRLREKYFTDYWRKYDFDIQLSRPGSAIHLRDRNSLKYTTVPPSFIKNSCKRVHNHNFYLNADAALSLVYLAKFHYQGIDMYVKFYPSLLYNRLSSETNNLKYSSYTSQWNNLALAKYYNGELQMWTGDYHYPPHSTALRRGEHAYSYNINGYHHYVRSFGKGGYIVCSLPEITINMHLILVSTIFGIFLFWVVVYYIIKYLKNKSIRNSIFSRMLLWLLAPLAIAFIATAWLSFTFFLRQYEQEMQYNSNTKIMTLQSALQEKLGTHSDLEMISSSNLDYILQEYSMVLHSDIIIYDSNGFQHSASSSDLKGLGARRKNEGASHIMNANAKCNLTLYPKTEESILGKKYATEYAYLYNANNVQVGYVQVLNNVLDKNRNSDVFNYIVFVLDAFLIVITLSFLVVWWINMRISAPIYEISNKLQRLQLTNANEKIYYSNKNDEIGQLVSRYNAMVDELVVSAEKLARSERETAWRDMARSIAHEIKNPLTPMKLSIQAAQRKQEMDPEHFEEYFNHTADLLVEQIENLARIATEFSDFAKVTAVEPERVDIVVRLRNAVALYLHNPEGVIVQSDITVNHPVYILGNEKQLMQVFNNLIRNAIQAIPEDQMGFVNVSLSTSDMNVEVRVKDNGTGVKPDIQKRMFEPNFTTKNSGMGLGLAITKSIVTACKGDISFETEEGVGTTFIVRFPIIK